ncbi:MAG: GNAT family N-acetyltransferase [Pseudomonadota bacterium]
MANVPDLVTERLTLRAVTAEDAAAYREHFIDYEVIRYLSAAVPWPYPDDGIENFLAAKLPQQGRDRWLWGLHLNGATTGLIGAIELWREGEPEHRGFWLGRAFWGRGYMSEAASAVTDAAFERFGFEELCLTNALDNARSHRIKEKAGAELLRVEPGAYVDPALTQQAVWRLRKADWLARRER